MTWSDGKTMVEDDGNAILQCLSGASLGSTTMLVLLKSFLTSPRRSAPAARRARVPRNWTVRNTRAVIRYAALRYPFTEG